ncbi:hypothetical protein EH165_01670 [Nakamurella antarctica]|uniref:Neutral zinc metallopeptidase n=1 Tax=Nakamurella antarctica TaxID=1902245 RepID=A0A3G8ZSL7_9ACTN|nr:neutral zinc metallopeptidase [Nakamurella antarctica]AZI57066.1 hypothetical protein EH165_01670 [Nakamurella antarctica]
MRFNDKARLDTSQVRDQRGGGGSGTGSGGLGSMFGGSSGNQRSGGGLGGLAKGGGGIGVLVVIGVVIYTLVTGNSGGGAGGLLNQLLAGGNSSNAQADTKTLQKECTTGADANTNSDCALVAIINSVQGYWTDQLAASGTTYQETDSVWFTGQVSTGCGNASSSTGPFYCPADQLVYVDLSFFTTLKTDFKANDLIFTQAYVLAHEYGHHVQNLLGTSNKVGSAAGPESGSVRLELQADCYAGAWANHATTVPGADGQILIADVNQTDINGALDAAAKIGDDYIQSTLGSGTVDESSFTHGSSKQREKWFMTGYTTGSPATCDTFGASNLG